MEDSFGKRYFIKLISTALITLINASIQIVLPKALGVNDYGVYTFNLNIFTSVIAIAILSMDSAFASKISKRRNELGLIKFYEIFILFISVLLNILLLIFYLANPNGVFSNQSLCTVFLALNASISLKILQEISSLFDCYAQTKLSEPLLVINKVGTAICVFLFYFLLLLKLNIFYIIQIVLSLGIGVIMLNLFFKRNKGCFDSCEPAKKYFPELYEYCRPLIIANIISNVVLILSNTILEMYGGNVETAYYGVAWQLNSLIAYTFTPIIALLQREYSIRINDKEKLRKFYCSILRIVILLVCFFSCFIIVNADTVLEAVFGIDYLGAVTVTRLIMVYTIFQAWGQVNGSMFTASERTKLYAKLSITMQLLSLLSVFVFQLPNIIWPDGLGSIGMGLQKTIVNIISVLICGYFNCKYLGINYFDEYKSPFMITVIFCGVAYFSRLLDGIIGNQEWSTICNFIVSGVVYSLICISISILLVKKLDVDLTSIIKVGNFKGKT